MIRPFLICVLFATCAVQPGGAVWAATYTVYPDGSGDLPTIQEALEAAADGDTIELTNGTFTGTGNRDIDGLGRSVTIRSQSDDPELCIIDCQASASDPHRAFDLHSGEDWDTIIQGIKITHAYAEQGGGIYGTECYPTIRNCTFEENDGVRGSAIYGWRFHAWIVDCTFSRNQSEDTNFYVDASYLTVERCDFIENSAPIGVGAGITSFSSTLQVDGCTFAKNQAWQGGAVSLSGFGPPSVIRNCLFSDNVAALIAGAIEFGGADLVIENCRFLRNEAHGIYNNWGGGAIRFLGDLQLDDCVFLDNVSDGYGGAVLCLGGSYEISECTFARNSGRDGGAIFDWGSDTASISNTVIAFSLSGMAVDCLSHGDVAISCSDIYGNADGNWVDCIADQAKVAGNFDLDPLFCDLAGEDLHLERGSPCLPGNHPHDFDCGVIGAYPIGCPVSGVEEGSAERVQSRISSIAPNPFRSRSRIELLVHDASQITPLRLEIYDAAGRLVRLLFHGDLATGRKILVWDGTNNAGHRVAPGTYFCRLKTTWQVEVQRVVIIR